MQLTVIQNRLLTPQSPDKSIYYLTLKVDSVRENRSDISYQPGDWLTLQAENNLDLVNQTLALLSLSGTEKITLRRHGEVTTTTALQSHLELTQLNPAILNKCQRQYGFGDWADRQAMMDYARGRDIIDLLMLFPSLQAMGLEFLQLLSSLTPRYYSIASILDENNLVSILYKHVRYEREGRERQGVTTRLLADLNTSDTVQGEFIANGNFKLPKDSKVPIIMIGAGTGIAPFIGFMQQRVQDSDGGENLLFFGETHRETSFLFEEDLTDWQAQKKLTLFTAFSRDQPQKIYVQDMIEQQKERIFSLIQSGGIIYICGSQSGLAVGVEAALKELFNESMALDEMNWQSLKDKRQIQMDVY